MQCNQFGAQVQWAADHKTTSRLIASYNIQRIQYDFIEILDEIKGNLFLLSQLDPNGPILFMTISS